MKQPLEIRIHVTDLGPTDLGQALAHELWRRAPHRAADPFENLDTALDRIRDANEFTRSQYFFDPARNHYVFRFL
jgi:hypothetical protein